ncbi:MAG: DNA-3-methyladenine glycosylase [Vicinamibacterales bacterium]
MPRRVLPASFYARPTLAVARDLVGMVLVHRAADGLTAGRIVETEAYIGATDPACHAYKGRTPRNETLYGPPGLAYVYVSYGLHHLLNAVTERADYPAAVLIRAVEPLDGQVRMRARRAAVSGQAAPADDAGLCRGPGNLTVAMGITTPTHDRRPLTAGRLTIEDDGVGGGAVVWTPRIGVTLAADRRWRCVAVGSRAVSGVRAWTARGTARPSRHPA